MGDGGITVGATPLQFPGQGASPGSLPPVNATVVHAMTRQAAAANAAAVATLAGVAGRQLWLLGYILFVGSAAAAGTALATITGLPTNTVSLDLSWTTTQGDRIVTMFGAPVPASALGGSIVGTVPATGAAGPACGVDLYGYLL
jgi:hypothetical protein